MENSICPKCGRQAVQDALCPNCGQAARNGAVPPAPRPVVKPPPPAEVSTWIITPTPPEMIEEFRRTFNEEEFLAGLREIEETGGLKFEDLIEELEQEMNRRD